MKLGYLLLGSVLVVGTCLALSLDTIPTDCSWPAGKVILNANGTNTQNAINTLITTSATLTNAVVGQVDSTGNTTNTLYTPKRVGDTLVGKAGGTNAIWVSNGVTTNSWKGPILVP